MPTQALADHASELLEHFPSTEGNRFVLRDRDADHEIPLNDELYQLLRSILIDLSQKRAVHVLPIDQELTTNQAAELLHVSRPFLIKLLDAGKIRFRKVGTHRRILLIDLLEYKREATHDASEAREALTKHAQELDWDY